MKVLLENLNSKNIAVKDTGKKYVPTKKYKERSEIIWRHLKQKSRKRGIKVWNGEVYRLAEIKTGKRLTTLMLGNIEFKYHYACSELLDLTNDLDFNKKPNGIYIATVMITKDRKYMFGLRSDSSLWNRKLAPIGGNLNRDEMKITKYNDLEKYIRKEIHEETNIQSNQIEKMHGIGVFQAFNGRIGIFFRTHLSETSYQILKNLKLNFEHEKMMFLNKHEVQKARKRDFTNTLYEIIKKYETN